MNEIIIYNKETGEVSIPADVAKYITDCLVATKLAKAREDAMKEIVINAMNENGIKKFECDEFLISVVDGVLKETFDVKKFKADYPEFYPAYVKETLASPSLRIKLRSAKGGESDE